VEGYDMEVKGERSPLFAEGVVGVGMEEALMSENVCDWLTDGHGLRPGNGLVADSGFTKGLDEELFVLSMRPLACPLVNSSGNRS